jgi:hypothetical protein
MIGWLNPGAFWALALAAAPIVIHLLRTHRATRVAFPSLRFVQPSRTAAVRMRLPSDVSLMIVRVAILALAAAALAGPIVLSASRMSTWNARTARAVVVDTSDSMRAPDATGARPERAAAEAADAELRSATYGRRFDAATLDDGVRRAARWLAASAPARREVVVISDLQRGAIGTTAAMAVPDGTGLRFVPVGRALDTARFEGARLLGAGATVPRDQTVEATADSTAVAMVARPGAEAIGLRLIAAADAEPAVARLLRAVANAGAPAGSADQPIAVRFAGAASETQAPLAPVTSGWMLSTVLRLLDYPGWSGASTPASPERRSATVDPWTTLARSGNGSPVVRVAASGNDLLLDVSASPDTFLAAEVVRAVLTARLDPRAYAEHEVARVDVTALARTPGPVGRDAWRTADSSDARWVWLAALILLGVEQWLRSRTANHRVEEAARAAA